MIIVRPDLNNFPKGPSIFLAGPTPRSADIKSWRPEAIQYLSDQGFNGMVYVPEPMALSYDEEIDWEETALNISKCIVFWIPRDLNFMPGFTTNIEFGTWKASGKCVVGWPIDAPKMKYISYYANQLKIPKAHTLTDTLDLALIKLGIK